MILGVLVRAVVAFLRRRGLNVPDPSRLWRRQPVVGVTNRAAEIIAESADEHLRRRADTRTNSNTDDTTNDARNERG